MKRDQEVSVPTVKGLQEMIETYTVVLLKKWYIWLWNASLFSRSIKTDSKISDRKFQIRANSPHTRLLSYHCLFVIWETVYLFMSKVIMEFLL